MRRFYLPPEQCQSDRLGLSGGQAHHAADVLRLKPGERVAVLDGAGGEFLCEALAVERKKIHLAVVNVARNPHRRAASP